MTSFRDSWQSASHCLFFSRTQISIVSRHKDRLQIDHSIYMFTIRYIVIWHSCVSHWYSCLIDRDDDQIQELQLLRRSYTYSLLQPGTRLRSGGKGEKNWWGRKQPRATESGLRRLWLLPQPFYKALVAYSVFFSKETKKVAIAKLFKVPTLAFKRDKKSVFQLRI